MFGSCAFRSILFVVIFGLGFSAFGQSRSSAQNRGSQQKSSSAQAAKGVTAEVVGEYPVVFAEPNFDSDIVAELKVGQRYTVTRAKKGPFHRIRVKPGVLGWIADSEVKLLGAGVSLTPPKKKQKSEESLGDIFSDESDDISALEENKKKRDRIFEWSRHRGLAIDQVQYTENTMGKERTAATSFFGFRLTGADTLFDGLMTADSHILFSPQAPSYYKSVTGESATGFILLSHFQFMTQKSLSPDVLYQYGFGPMVKYSHFSLQNGGQSYTADDLNVGAVFGFGLGFRFGKVAVRPDFKYYWEKTKYWSLGLGLLWQY